MRYTRIPGFSGIENHRQDTNLGTLRVCEGAVMGAVGSIRSAPIWKQEFPLDIPGAGNHVLIGQDTQQNKYAMVTESGQVTNLKMFTNENPVPSRIGNLIALESKAQLTSNNPVFVNDVGSRQAFLGNGVDQKKIIDVVGGPLEVTDLDPDEDSIYKQETTPFPNCSMFVVGMRKSIYASGDPTAPLTVYISEPMSADSPVKEGIYSTQMSKVDILATNATKITALSTYQNYVVVHTDAGVVLLYSVETPQSSAGFRVEQVSAASNSGAVNQNCCAGSAIVQPYYLGVDGEVYKDSSARRGPDNKPSFSDVEQVTAKAKGLWNTAVDGDFNGSFSAYETFSGVYNFYMPASEKAEQSGGKFQGYYWFDQQDAITGPVLHPKVTAVTSVSDTSLLLGVSEDNKLLSCDMEQLKESRTLAGPTVDPWANVGSTVPGTDLVVSVDKAAGKFNFSGRSYNGPFEESKVGDTVLNNPVHYPDAYLSVIETSFEDMQASHVAKQFHEIVANFQGDSFGDVFIYGQNEEGLSKGGFKGSLKDKSKMKSFINLRGDRLRIRLYVITHKDYEWVLTDLAVGFLVTKIVF
tara:strand:- start:1226 stop:2965 length:1740 start_codon:yes stop_codon:yes gene_type:complete